MKQLQFPKTVRACKTNDLGQWTIAEALLKEANEGNTGTKGLLAVAEELKQNGIEHTIAYLRLLRQAAEMFGPNRRHSDIPLRVHFAAGNPDALDVIVKVAHQEGKVVTTNFVENVLREIRAGVREKTRLERAKAHTEEQEAAEEERKAQTPEQREAAKAKRQQAAAKRKAVRSPRRKDLPAPEEKDVNPLNARAQFMQNANEARRLASKALKLIRPNLDEYSPAAVAGLLDACLTVANTWRETANTLATVTHKSGKSLLSVVNE
jgi:hypothetical protein